MNRPLRPINFTSGAGPRLRRIGEQLDELESRLNAGGRLWQREWAATSLRAALHELAEIADEEPEHAAPYQARCEALRERMRAADAQELGALRERLCRGALPPAEFLTHLRGVPSFEWDVFVWKLLRIDEVPAAARERAAEMIKYQATPTAAALALIEQLAPDDVLYDLGCGLGLVALLAGYLSPCRVKGVEIDPAYAGVAAARAAEFGLGRVEVIAKDVREVDLSDGTIFYFFYPFEGGIMREVLDRLRALAAERPIRIASLGQCTPAFLAEPWLQPASQHAHGMTIFHAVHVP